MQAVALSILLCKKCAAAAGVPIHLFINPNSMNKTTILIADDHTLIRETWSFLLNAHPDFTVAGECGSGEEAVELARSLRPAIVLLDINLPGMNGIEATAAIRRVSPTSRVLGISMHTHPTFARHMMRQGASGYITKTSPREEMFRALEAVLQGKKFICQEIKDALSEEIIGSDSAREALHALTSRELQIISRIAVGETSREIGEQLGVALKTIEVHRYNILQKLQLKNTAALVNFINHHRLELIS